MATLSAIPVVLQLQIIFINTRSIYEIREQASRMYSWTALVTAQIFSEVPFNMVGSTIFFVIWYFLVGYPNDRAGFSFLMMGIAFPCLYTTSGLAVAAMAPNVEMAANLYNFFNTFLTN